jgi:hypothetical protein
MLPPFSLSMFTCRRRDGDKEGMGIKRCMRIRRVQGGAGRCREVQGGAGREVQGGAGGCNEGGAMREVQSGRCNQGGAMPSS